MKNLSGTQKQIQNPQPNLLQQFKASQGLCKSLKQEHPKEDTVKRVFTNTGKELLKQAKIEKANEKFIKKEEITIESEVIGLSNFAKPITCARTEELIKRQRESRRDRHIKALNDFEKWIENLHNDVSENYVDIKQDIVYFFEQSDIEINNYFASLTNDFLMKREKEILDEMKKIVEEHRVKRNSKVQNLDNRLENLEKDREKNLCYFCDSLEYQLIDIAFILEPEVKELVAAKRQSFTQLLEQKRKENVIYVDEVNLKQKTTFETYDKMRNEKELLWRKLRHDEAFLQFQEDIKLMIYVNPPQRVALYQSFKEKHLEVFNKRKDFLSKLSQVDMSILSKAICEKWLEDVRYYNEKAQAIYDKCVDELMKESEEANRNALSRIQKLRDRLEYIGHLNQQDLDTLLSEKCLSIQKSLYESSRKLISDAIKFVEDSDFKTNELIQNIGKFFQKIGNLNDEQKKQQQTMAFNYELEKATCADNNDEKLDQLNTEFEAIKVELKMALHHPKLNEVLQKCFNQIDLIEKEYREFHDKNVVIARNHPNTIKTHFLGYERQGTVLYQLLDETQKKIIEERNQKLAEEKVKKMIEKEEKLKLIEEEKALQDNKDKKGAKKPAQPKKVDPKKAAADYELRFKELLQQVGVEPVNYYKTSLGNQWIEPMVMEEFSKKFYQISEDDSQKKKEETQQQQESPQKQDPPQQPAQPQQQKENPKDQQQKGQDQKNKAAPGKEPPKGQGKEQPKEEVIEQPLVIEEEKPPIPVDFKDDPPIDPEGRVILAKDVIIELTIVNDIIIQFRQKLFDYILKKLDEAQDEAKIQDREFVENSILILDERLKLHYPLKGKMEVEIFQVRSSQITQHKKRYERHTRTTIEKIDLQTENFNYLLETALDDTKEYVKQQTDERELLPSGHTLAVLQGIQNAVKENCFKFDQKITDLMEKLIQFANDEVDFLLNKNREFIKESKLFENGGEYSKDEVDWYEGMIKEIDTQLNDQKLKRQERSKEIKDYMDKKKQEMITIFEKVYALTIDELAARDGTGKKFGRPRRLAQERTRSEMNKCEKAQESIQNNILELKKMNEEFKQNSQNSELHINEVRRVLMILRTSIGRYVQHIEGLKQGNQVIDMKRVTYIENKPDCLLDPSENEQDQNWKSQELEALGPLFFQKETKTFMEWITDIEKTIIAEAQKLYIGDKAKFLTGADKIPDYLRLYLENMKKKMAEFRISSIRNLRNSCEEISQLSPQISEMVLESTRFRYQSIIDHNYNDSFNTFTKILNEMTKQKELHMFKLRPNLSNPQCKQELDNLLNEEKKRLTQYQEVILTSKKDILDLKFKKSNEFFFAILNHFEFLITYFDSELLWEDFIKLPGDEDIQKKHENVKILLRLKQTGQTIDTSSERALQKVWPGLLIDSFTIEDRKIQYQLTAPVEQEAEKGGKKPAAAKGGKAAPKQGQPEELQQNVTNTKEIKSYKTYRQKSASSQKNKAYDNFLKQFQSSVANIIFTFKDLYEKEQKFEFKWLQTVQDLNKIE